MTPSRYIDKYDIDLRTVFWNQTLPVHMTSFSNKYLKVALLDFFGDFLVKIKQ